MTSEFRVSRAWVLNQLSAWKRMPSWVPAILALTLLSTCGKSPTERPVDAVESEQLQTIVLRIPWTAEETSRKLWQRSYPESYADLRVRAAESRSGNDPFADPIEVPDDQLTPGSFGMRSWGRGIVRQVFAALGHPVSGSAVANYESETRLLTVTHSPEAIDALRERFPEFEDTKIEAAPFEGRVPSN